MFSCLSLIFWLRLSLIFWLGLNDYAIECMFIIKMQKLLDILRTLDISYIPIGFMRACRDLIC